MDKEKRIAIIGHFGGGEDILDGQTVKTKILYQELSNATEWNIKIVDTYYKKKNPVKLLMQTISALLSRKDVIVLLSGNGMNVYFPLLYVAKKILRTRVYHDVIGGNLDSYVEQRPSFEKYLNAFEVNWVETDGLKKRLEAKGVRNCDVIPNFKRLSCVTPEELTIPNGEHFRFCIFSRVMKEKGIEDAIEAVQAINEEAAKPVCSLDIYGLVDERYTERFTDIINSAPPEIRYCGKVPYEKSVETIKEYHALLFPTFWQGEGFPGTIVDAFSAGLPVIATDWSCNGEIVQNGDNGILYPNETTKDLKSSIEAFMKNKDQLLEMKQRCVESARLYQPDAYIRKIITYIGEKGKD